MKPEVYDETDKKSTIDEASVATPVLGRIRSGLSDAQGSEFSYRSRPPKDKRRHLFTVKPGGIAGYMGWSLLLC